jgi:hypothetical protein
MKQDFITGSNLNPAGPVPVISTEYGTTEMIGAIKVRWGFGRDNYKVVPGLYAVGNPDSSSDVFVTANYKLTFDILRKNLVGLNGWILVLDTKGVNVWCAAGKGTFGTKELINRIKLVSLDKVVSHKKIILPQLGAPGVAAHKVREESGFNVHYGPVRASDIKKFIEAGYRATKGMRKVTFSLTERVKLVPNDFMYGKFYLLGAFAAAFLISYFGTRQSEAGDSVRNGLSAILNIFLGYCAGVVITPVLLPWLPGRRFSLKGFFAGIVMAIILTLFHKTGNNIYEIVAWFMVITSIASFMAMNFTGSSTFTSLSGVKKEMKIALPMQIISVAIGVILLIISKFLT